MTIQKVVRSVLKLMEINGEITKHFHKELQVQSICPICR